MDSIATSAQRSTISSGIVKTKCAAFCPAPPGGDAAGRPRGPLQTGRPRATGAGAGCPGTGPPRPGVGWDAERRQAGIRDALENLVGPSGLDVLAGKARVPTSTGGPFTASSNAIIAKSYRPGI